MRDWLPRVYPILDSSFLPREGRSAYLDRLGRSLAEAGVRLLEYRNKTGSDAEVLADARVLRAAMPSARGRSNIWLVMDDRVDVALAAGFDGVHVDAGDLPPADARRLLGTNRLVGTSASNEAELRVALKAPIDYIAFGPVFATTTKNTSAEPIGVAGVRHMREAAGPDAVLVAAAGITLATAPSVLRAGADAVAVAAGIFKAENPAAEFHHWMERLS
jgi:thiamine-phosphate pyrophosphorylase